MSSLGFGSLGLNPYMLTSSLNPYMYTNSVNPYSYMSSGQLGLASNMSSFANVLQKALYSLPTGTCECGCSCSKAVAGTAENQPYMEQYRSSLKDSLIQSGKINNRTAAALQSGKSGYTRRALNSYKTYKTHVL